MARRGNDDVDDLNLGGMNIGPSFPSNILRGTNFVHSNTTNVTYISNNIIINVFNNNVSPAAGGAGDGDEVPIPPPLDPNSLPFITPNEEPGSGVTLVVVGIVGKDEKDNVFAPQKLTFIYNKADEKQERKVKKEIAENIENWNAIPGCSCSTFTFEMNNWVGDPINVISGLTHGYTNKILPVLRPPQP